MRKRIFDYLKAICIIFVVTTHLLWTDQQRLNFLFPYTVDMAIPVFMIISGYVNMLSANKHKEYSLKNMYALQIIIPKLTRIFAPYIVVYAFLALVFIFNGSVGVSEAALAFFTGGWGPGSYYVPILIQFTLLSPLMLFVIKEFKYKGYALLLSLNILLEACFTYFKIPVDIYRLSFFRYIVFVCAGMYLYEAKDKINKTVLSIFLALGVGYIMAANYFGYTPKIFTNWVVTSFPTVLYIFPVVAVSVMVFTKPLPDKFGGKILATVGETTYHIYLVQMVWYVLYGNYFGPWIMLIPNVILCCVGGIIFSKLDNIFFQKPIKRLLNRFENKIYKEKQNV